MILLCEVISGDLVLQYSRWFGLWGHISVDLPQELIGRRRACMCVCVCVCRKRKLWFVVRPMACSQRRECGRYVCLCLFSSTTPLQHTYIQTHTHTLFSGFFWEKVRGRSRVFNGLQENAAKYCHPLLHCSAHSSETGTRCQILLWKDTFFHTKWDTLNIHVLFLHVCKTVVLYLYALS